VNGEETYETNPGRGSDWIPFGDKTEFGGDHKVGTAGIRASLCTDKVSAVYCAYYREFHFEVEQPAFVVFKLVA
jgi:hypothetical protein